VRLKGLQIAAWVMPRGCRVVCLWWFVSNLIVWLYVRVDDPKGYLQLCSSKLNVLDSRVHVQTADSERKNTSIAPSMYCET
jgi:hypothetical protein